MCGRFTIFSDISVLLKRFGASLGAGTYTPTYNAAPTQFLPVIANQNINEILFYKWGLVPFWARDPAIGNKMINARAETVNEKPSFKNLVAKKRCLVLSDGFYEWKKTDKGKVPYFITLSSHEPFAFAGLWDTWKTPQGKELNTFTIITTEPNSLMKEVHHRMPVILSPENEQAWLQGDFKNSGDILLPCDADKMILHPVSNRVNSPANNDVSLIKRAQ